MQLPGHDHPPDSAAQRAADWLRFRRAVVASALSVAVLAVVHLAQAGFDARLFAVGPGSVRGLFGILTAPLLHGSLEHIVANSVAVLLLGTLAGWVYPRAALRGLPLMWLGSGLGAWLLGEPGSWHLGASGVTHGLMFLVMALAVLRRDRAAIAASMIGFMFYGGMLLTVLPREPGVSWQSHLGGAGGGIVAAWLFRRFDPRPPRKRYSWELEEEQAALEAARAEAERAQYEASAADDVPVIWNRPADDGRGKILRFPPRDRG
ncbi:MAG: rhomboid family intramembrane serine protease [Gammaproteobacteria bacterium]|jgi:membrane associated rhomboid family serine protease|nr:rhomboid family intramembrane serine protease [Gammaproteobacteria bacterium]